MEEVLKEFKEYAKARTLIDPTIDPQFSHSHNQSTEAGSQDNGGAEVIKDTAGSKNIMNDEMDNECDAVAPVRSDQSQMNKQENKKTKHSDKGKNKMKKYSGRGKGRWHHPYAPTQATYNNSPVTYNINHNIHYHKD